MGNKFYFGMLVLIFVMIIAWTSYMMTSYEKEDETYRISVIVNDSNSDRWTSFRLGLEQAARDWNIDLNYVSAGRIGSLEEETALINRELENGAEGIIVQMVSSEENALESMDFSSNPTMILLESDIIPENQYSLVGPNNLEIGRELAASIKKDYGGELAGKRIGIVSGNQKQLSMQQRLKGLKDGFEEESVNIIWEIEHMEVVNEEYERQFEQMETVDILIALENDETERMVDFLQKEETEEESCFLYGVGCSEKAVYYLDKGVIKTLVVPNEFNMGYQSMEAVAKQLKYHLDKAEDSQVDYLVINQMNMYDTDNQKVLFPIVQ